ncbi:hypothetical protein N9L68_08560 [bacterium]|nr:hypothetical protein [bacterium]
MLLDGKNQQAKVVIRGNTIHVKATRIEEGDFDFDTIGKKAELQLGSMRTAEEGGYLTDHDSELEDSIANGLRYP